MSNTKEGVYLMIKTLRITGVAAVAFAGVVLASVLGPVSLIHLDDRNDQQMVKILDAPGAVERFQKQHAGSNAGQPGYQAAAGECRRSLSRILSIRSSRPRSPSADAGHDCSPDADGQDRRPPSAKFTADRDELLALESEFLVCVHSSADNTFQWVQCGSEVGHLTIKEVKEGSVICWDGNRESEVPMEPVPDRVSLLEADDDAGSRRRRPQPVEVQGQRTVRHVRPARVSQCRPPCRR